MSISPDFIVRCPFELEDLPRFPSSHLGHTLFSYLRKHPKHKVALVEVISGGEITFDEIIRQAELFGHHLLERGCGRGDVVAIFAPNSIDWCIALLGTLRIGAVASGINKYLTVNELKFQLNQCRANFVATDQPLERTVAVDIKESCHSIKDIIVIDGRTELIDSQSMAEKNIGDSPSLPNWELDVNWTPNDPAIILFSSGTTGLQKAVQMSHRNWLTEFKNIWNPRMGICFDPQVIYLPLAHVGGLLFVLLGLALGYTSHITPKFDLRVLINVLADNQITGFLAVPPVATLLAKSPLTDTLRLPFLRSILVGAAPAGKDLEDQLIRKFHGVKIRQIYGMTEMVCLTTMCPDYDDRIDRERKPGSVGVPVQSVQHKVVDLRTGATLGPNQRGEICFKSDTCMIGYIGHSTDGTIDKDGWFHSGDIGSYDEDGYFYIIDRLKELIKYNAYQVAPAELEAVLLSHPSVADAGVFGIPHPTAGEHPVAWVVKKPNAMLTEEELGSYVAERVAPYKRLRGGIHFVAAIPKSPSGKILRRQMKATFFRAKL